MNAQDETIVTRPADPLIGSLCGNFRILRKLGRGGMGVVYEAEHDKIGKRAAVKVLHGEIAGKPEFAARFLNEARSVNIARHPGLVEIFDFGQQSNGTLFIVMEFLDGQTIYDRYIARGQRVAPAPVVRLGLQIAQALVSAHAQNIVHRDLKPENIMLIRDPVHPDEPRVKILDFGIAKLALRATPAASGGNQTGIGAFLGTPKYMAPEQFGSAETVDGRADVFSLGVILYELLAGKPPYEGTPLALMSGAPPLLNSLRSDVSADLAELIGSMMAVRASQRPTMLAVSQQLAAWAGQPPTTLRQPRWLILLGVLTGLAVVAGVAATMRLLRPPSLPQARLAALAAVEGSLGAKAEGERLLALAAVSQSRDSSLHSLVRPLLSDHRPEISAATARTLGEIGALAAIADLKPLLSAADPRLRLESATALARLSQPSGLKYLHELLESSDSLTQVEAALRLLELGDLAGSSLLKRITSARSELDARTLLIVGALARASDPEARQRLLDQSRTAVAGPLLPQLTFALSRTGDGAARAQLESLADKVGPAQLLSARLLANLGDPRGYALLRDTAANSQQSEPLRAIAIDGLGDCGDPVAAPILYKLLDERGISSRLRLLAAGAILQLSAGDPGVLAEQTLAWTHTALGSESIAVRDMAAILLGDLETGQNLTGLAQAVRDREREVRRSAARSLGRKNARQALAMLAQVLDDADDEVRELGMRSIARVSAALKQSGDQKADKLVVDRLSQLTLAGDERDRVAAAGTLLQLGDRSRRALVVAGLSSGTPLVRRLAVEVLEPDEPLLRQALSDGDRLVRLAAARRLAAAGRREAVPVLREIVGSGDLPALTAYGILKRLGETTALPPDLGSLLHTSSLPDRYAITEILGDLPPRQGYQLLLLAAQDPAAIIRRRAAEMAATYWQQTRQPAFLRLVRGLLHDPEVAVREKAAQIIRGLPPSAANAAAPSEPEPESESESVDSEPAAIVAKVESLPDRGQILLLGEAGVRVQVDTGAAQAIADKPQPLSVPVGKHRLVYVGGQQEISVTAGQMVTIRVPATLVEQLLQDAQEALANRELNRAQSLLDRCRRLSQSSAIKPQFQGDLLFLSARLNEAKSQLREAMAGYARYQRLPPVQQRADFLNQVRVAVTRLTPRLGHIQIFATRDGRCQLVDEYYLPPGDHLVGTGSGKSTVVTVYAGLTRPIRQCQ